MVREIDDEQAIFMLGEELKKPLTAIKALSELSETSSDSNRLIQLEAERALRTIDNVLDYQRISENQLSLELGPVHVGSTLTQIEYTLRPLSLERGCETEVFIQSGLPCISAHPEALRIGIESLWQATLNMTLHPSAVTWSVSRVRNGVRVSVTNSSLDLRHVFLSKKNKNAGNSRQPFAGLSGPSTDLITAINVFETMSGGIKKKTRGGKAGFSVTLPIVQQLAFV